MTATPIPPSHPEAAQLERLRRAVAPSRGVVIKRILVLTLLAVCVYVLGPSVLATLNAWPQVKQISWLWLIGMAARKLRTTNIRTPDINSVQMIEMRNIQLYRDMVQCSGGPFPDH